MEISGISGGGGVWHASSTPPETYKEIETN